MPGATAATGTAIPILGTNVAVAAVILVLGIVLFIVLCYIGMHTAVSALIASALVALTATDGFITTITSTWVSGIGQFATQNGLAFISASLFGYLMRETKSGEAVAMRMVRITGADHAPYIIAATAAILQLAGISSYMFIVSAMAFSLMKEANLPIYLGYAACVGVSPIVSFTLPGVTAMPNVLPTTYLGTTTWAAPGLSLACAAVGIVLAVCYLQHVIHKARKEGKGYEPRGDEKVAASRELFGGGEIQLPAFWKAIVPIVLVIVLCAFFQLALKPLFGVENLSAMNALVFSMWITSAVTIFLNWDTVHNKLHVIPTLSRGMTELVPFIVLSGAVYGFGLVTQASACFQPLQELILSIDINPYFTVWLSVCLIAGLCADGVSGMVMWLSIFGSEYGVGNTNGVNPAAVHRIAVSAATTFDSLPHSAHIAQGLALFKTDHKESYKYTFVLTVVFPVIFSLVAVIGAILFY